MAGNSSYWHVYSDGKLVEVLFRDDAEFISGMNRIALCVILSVCRVHAFCLMSNHIHILVSGTAESVRRFINEYKRLTGIWIMSHGRQPLAGYLEVGVKMVDTLEYLLSTVAYIHRNPMLAGYKYRIDSYPWSSAHLYFSADIAGLANPAGQTETMEHSDLVNKTFGRLVRVSSMGQLRIRKMIGSHIKIPGDWLINEDGMIFPGSYTSYQAIERKFDTQRHYLAVLSRKSELDINQSLAGNHRIMLSDREVRGIVLEMADRCFHATSVLDMGISERLMLASRLRTRYGIPFKQLERILRIKDNVLRESI